MENAAKALSIAGGILIAVMLAVLVYYVFTHWGESQRIKQEDVEVQKVEDFNKSYLSYEKVLYGSELLGQQFIDDTHMWGRIMIIDGETFTNKDGEKTMYGLASNSSPASEDYEKVIAERVAMIEAANPEQKGKQIPVDLVTVSGSGLDPHISLAAAEYQIPRLVRTTGKSEAEIRKIIDKYTDHGFLGYFGETTVNVLKVNLALDGILK